MGSPSLRPAGTLTLPGSAWSTMQAWRDPWLVSLHLAFRDQPAYRKQGSRAWWSRVQVLELRQT